MNKNKTFKDLNFKQKRFLGIILFPLFPLIVILPILYTLKYDISDAFEYWKETFWNK